MDKLNKIIKEALQGRKLNESQSCKIPSLLNENLKHTHFISEQFRSLIDSKKPLIQEIKRINDVSLIREARILFDKGILNLPPKCQEYMETSDFGKYKLKEGKIILEGLEDKSINIKYANLLSNHLMELLSREKPLIAIVKWKEFLKQKLGGIKLNPKQIEDLSKDAFGLLGNTNKNTLKQVIRGKILKLLKGEEIR